MSEGEKCLVSAFDMNHCMDLAESKRIAREVLDKEGYKDYEITTNLHVDHTNVFEVIATKNNSKVIITRAEGEKQIIGMWEEITHFIFIEEDKNDHMGKEAYALFDLEERLSLGGKIVNRVDVELVLENGDKHIVGIRIKMVDTKEENVREATEKANRVANFLSHQTNIAVQLKRPKISMIEDGKATHTINFTVGAILTKACDVDLEDASSLIDSDSPLNGQLARHKEGIRSLTRNDFGEALRMFYQVIENSKLPEEKYYRVLRHSLNHERLERTDVADLQKFGINMQLGDQLNLNDPRIQFVLQKEARKLQEVSLHYLDGEVRKMSVKSRW